MSLEELENLAEEYGLPWGNPETVEEAVYQIMRYFTPVPSP
jgi:hypothetical protein